jgi:hypothetical protein
MLWDRLGSWATKAHQGLLEGRVEHRTDRLTWLNGCIGTFQQASDHPCTLVKIDCNDDVRSVVGKFRTQRPDIPGLGGTRWRHRLCSARASDDPFAKRPTMGRYLGR